jgi:putative phosphoribosyl transferase
VVFRDRVDAGQRLAAAVAEVVDSQQIEAPVVLALPRGGVPVAAEVARALRAPLDVILVRKLGAPGRAELAMGAIGEDGVRVLNDEVIRAAVASEADLRAVEARERTELDRRAPARGSRRRGRRRGNPGAPVGDRSLVRGLRPDCRRRSGAIAANRAGVTGGDPRWLRERVEARARLSWWCPRAAVPVAPS